MSVMKKVLVNQWSEIKPTKREIKKTKKPKTNKRKLHTFNQQKQMKKTWSNNKKRFIINKRHRFNLNQ